MRRHDGANDLRWVVALVALCLWWPCGAALAHDRPGAAPDGDAKRADIDSEHIFGITEGSDIGDAGEKEVEAEPFGRFGKRVGTYAATSTALSFKYTPVDNFRFAPILSFASHNISNVPGLDNSEKFTLEGAGAELRFRLLDREKAPFGLTLAAALQRNRIDETSGVPVEQYAVELAALLDKELVPERFFAALNLRYGPEWTRPRSTGEWERDATIGISAAVSAQVAAGVFVAAEARYLRKYEGAALGTFLGEAFVGPSLYVHLPNHWFASVAGTCRWPAMLPTTRSASTSPTLSARKSSCGSAPALARPARPRRPQPWHHPAVA